MWLNVKNCWSWYCSCDCCLSVNSVILHVLVCFSISYVVVMIVACFSLWREKSPSRRAGNFLRLPLLICVVSIVLAVRNLGWGYVPPPAQWRRHLWQLCLSVFFFERPSHSWSASKWLGSMSSNSPVMLVFSVGLWNSDRVTSNIVVNAGGYGKSETAVMSATSQKRYKTLNIVTE